MSRRDTRPEKADEGAGRSYWVWLVPLGLLALLVVLYLLWPDYRDFFDKALRLISSGRREELQTWVASYGAWGALLIIALMLLQTVLPFIPSVLLMVVAVLAYGPLWGGLLSWLGLLLAAATAYLIGRALGPVTVDRLIGRRAERRMENLVERYGIWGIIAARVSPALSTDAVSYAAGLLKMRVERFLLATAIGILPLAALISFLGEDIDRLGNGLIWISVVSLLAFIGYVVFDSKRSGPREDGQADAEVGE